MTDVGLFRKNTAKACDALHDKRRRPWPFMMAKGFDKDDGPEEACYKNANNEPREMTHINAVPAAMTTFLHKKHVLSLALCLQHGQPWACNAFYAFDAQQAEFCILTEHKTLHAAIMQASPRVAGTVSSVTAVVAKIQGVQFTATARELEGDERQDAYGGYYRRFPFARAFPAPIWALTVESMKMTSNLLGFGHKISWNRWG